MYLAIKKPKEQHTIYKERKFSNMKNHLSNRRFYLKVLQISKLDRKKILLNLINIYKFFGIILYKMEMQIIKKVKKIGGSYAVIIPKEVLDLFEIEEGDFLVLKVVDVIKKGNNK